MFLAKLRVSEFLTRADSIWKELEANFKIQYKQATSPSEVNSWKKSLPALAEVLAKTSDAVKGCFIYIEYGMPNSSCRADALLAGCDSQGYRAGVVIELKQWDARSIKVDGSNVLVMGSIAPHPSDQALGYKDYLSDLSLAFADENKTLKSCAYLHGSFSYSSRHILSGPFEKLCELSPVFASDQKDRMANWVSGLLITPPDSKYVAELDSDQVRISKTLFDCVATAVRKEPSWRLLDEQITVFKQIKDLAERDDGEKHLVLVTGGPGTGKSVIAMQLLGELSRKRIPAVHITNSKCFTTVMKSLIQVKGDRVWGTKAVDGLFKQSHGWVKQKVNFDVAICDEAHRFRKTTNLWPRLISNRPQAEEIMECTRITVAFIDERQRLRKAEDGTIEYFRQCGAKVGVKPENIHGPIELLAQFRCRGNNGFIQALDKVIYEGAMQTSYPENYDLRIVDSISDLEAALQVRIQDGYKARLVAGFCWPWSDPENNGQLVNDVKIDTWQRPWNRKAENDNCPAEKHPYTIWANRLNDPLSEVGCIYSAQGFEFDYVGVIWADDLVMRNGMWFAQPGQSYDSEMRQRKKTTPVNVALPLLQNAYRVLCSRGIRGCYIYCIDQETRDFLKASLQQ